MQKLEEGKAASAAQAEEVPVDEAQQQREATEEWAKMERGHEVDIQDREWAPSAQRRFQAGLTPVSEELGFKVAATEMNCARRISLDAPQNPNDAYTTKLYLDCADQRARLVDELAAN